MIQSVKGMRDFYPEDYRVREWLFSIFREASLSAGFEFYDSPPVEHEELYTRKAGEEISSQLYVFEDKSGRSLALRPEMTPSLVRMVIQRQKELPDILKWASIPQCFRYERMTRGRKREHFQWNLDYLGEPSMIAEVEVISTALHAIEKMGLGSDDVKVRISNRNLYSELLTHLGLEKSLHLKVFLVIDKLGKLSHTELLHSLVEEGISKEHGERILEISSWKEIEQVEAFLKNAQGLGRGLEEVRTLFSYLRDYGFAQYLSFDLSVVRGLAYYTGTVFELFDAGKSLRAIAGGGRYDDLIGHLAGARKGGQEISIPAVGFGFGDVVILEFLADLKRIPRLNPCLDFYLIPFSLEEFRGLLPLLHHLRSRGLRTQLHYPPQKVKKMLQKAEKLGADYAVLCGSEEREKGMLRLKNLKTFEEKLISKDDFLSLAANHAACKNQA